MTTADILARVQAAGIRLRVDGEQLLASPRARLTDELRALIRMHRGELLQALNRSSLENRIRVMGEWWRYPPEDLAYALAGAADDPAGWFELVTVDEQYRTTHPDLRPILGPVHA